MRTDSHFHKAIRAMLFGVLLVSGASTALAQNTSTDSTMTEREGTEEVADAGLPSYTITPVVANEKAKPRDIIKKELVITNNTNQRLDLYLTVEDIDPQNGSAPYEGVSDADLSTSLASWVEITRGVLELAGGESRKVPYLVHVNLTAKPGSYFAHIRAREGSTRQQAEARSDGATLILNLEVLDDAKERLQLGTFGTDDSIIFGSNVSFQYLLENVGNRDIEPRGSIRIFNRRGEEVGSVPLNADGVEITPENKEQLAAAWSAAGRFGKYKAFLDLEYGENQLASVQDTVYFWVFPWKEILASLVGVLVLAVVGTFIIHMRAVARPRPAYAPREQMQEEYDGVAQTQPAAYGAAPLRSALPRAPGAMRHAVKTEQHLRIQDSRRGATVALAPRSPRASVAHGNTVTLQPRR